MSGTGGHEAESGPESQENGSMVHEKNVENESPSPRATARSDDEESARRARLADEAAEEWRGARLRPSSFDRERLEARRRQRREVASLADLSTIGLVFPAALAFGYFAGRFIGGLVDAAEAGGMIGGVIGIVGGFYNVYKVAVRLQESDEDGTDRAAEVERDRRSDKDPGAERLP